MFRPTNEMGSPITHSSGMTPTETLLKQLGDQSFLKFWSHANPHLTPKYELCDLLVVCGDVVILFSDKNNGYAHHSDPSVSRRRWYREAVEKSVDQLNGAFRSLFKQDRAIYKDKACKVPIGLEIPNIDQAKVYEVAVVSLLNDVENQDLFEPFVSIDSKQLGDAHLAEGIPAYAIGDVNPGKHFVHVIDLGGLRALLIELDTISDFTRYLDSREAFIRDKPENSADSEYSILARYMYSFDTVGNQMPLDDRTPGSTILSRSEWDNFEFAEIMNRRKEANRDSYIWDQLIHLHAHMNETNTFSYTSLQSIEESEFVVRQMALENRLRRRILGKAWKQACEMPRPEVSARLRIVPNSRNDGPIYVFLAVQNLLDEPIEKYQGRRRSLLTQMMTSTVYEYPEAKYVIGIGSDFGNPPSSYDHAFLDVVSQTYAEFQQEIKQAWELRKDVFEDWGTTKSDEWDIPLITTAFGPP